MSRLGAGLLSKLAQSCSTKLDSDDIKARGQHESGRDGWYVRTLFRANGRKNGTEIVSCAAGAWGKAAPAMTKRCSDGSVGSGLGAAMRMLAASAPNGSRGRSGDLGPPAGAIGWSPSSARTAGPQELLAARSGAGTVGVASKALAAAMASAMRPLRPP